MFVLNNIGFVHTVFYTFCKWANPCYFCFISHLCHFTENSVEILYIRTSKKKSSLILSLHRRIKSTVCISEKCCSTLEKLDVVNKANKTCLYFLSFRFTSSSAEVQVRPQGLFFTFSLLLFAGCYYQHTPPSLTELKDIPSYCVCAYACVCVRERLKETWIRNKMKVLPWFNVGYEITSWLINS